MRSKAKPKAHSANPTRILPTNDDPLLTIQEVADALGVTLRKARRMIEWNEIEYVKLNRLVRVRRSAVERVIEAGTVPAKDE